MSRGRPKLQYETKSKRINLLIKPSAYEAIEKINYINQDTFNSLVNKLLDNYIEQHAADIKKYDEEIAVKNE